MPSRGGRGGGGQKRLSFPSNAHSAHTSNKRQRSISPSPSPLLHLPASPPSSPHSPALPRSIRHVQLGGWQLDSWHHSPYPPDYQTAQLFVCERCLRYSRSSPSMKQHAASACDGRPPGRLVYCDAERGARVYELDGGGGEADELYCQCLCLLCKLFIQHKTVFYDVTPFLFYILTLRSPNGGEERLAAYFSKEKATTEHNNLACIVTLPHMQQKGYGRFLIQLSYQLTLHAARAHGRRGTGGPERPLSELAVISYTSYWCDEVSRRMAEARVGSFLALRDMAAATAIERSDLVAALRALGVECSERDGERGVRVSRDTKQRMARRADEEEAKRVQRGDIVFDAQCLRLADDERKEKEEEEDEMKEAQEQEEEAEQSAQESEAEPEAKKREEQESDATSEEDVVLVRKVRRKGGKRRSVAVTPKKGEKLVLYSAARRKGKDSDDEWDVDSDAESAESDE